MEGHLRASGVDGKPGKDKPTLSLLEAKGKSSDSADGTGKLISASTTLSSSEEMVSTGYPTSIAQVLHCKYVVFVSHSQIL